MFYRIFLFLGLNILMSQSFFNNVTANEIGFQSGRASAMGRLTLLIPILQLLHLGIQRVCLLSISREVISFLD